MKVWAIANQKGGVGKTTTAITLAGVMHNRGYRVLLIDLDPHGSLSSYLKQDPDDVDPSVYDLFYKSADVQSVVRQSEFERISFLPASTALATLDRRLGTKDGMGLVIKKALHQLQHYFDYVLIDCPPMLGLLMVNALAACDRLLIPVQTEFLALKGLERMLQTIRMIQKARKHAINYMIVPTFFDKRLKASNETLKTLKSSYSDCIWDGYIPIDTLFRDASRQGKPLSIARPSCRGSRAYSHLLDYLEGKEADLSYQQMEQEAEI